MARKSAVLTVAVISAVLLAAPAAAQEGPRQEAKLEFTAKKAGKPTGHEIRIDYRDPSNPEGKPPAVRRVVEIFARGTRFDTSVPNLCTALDPELMLLGPGACSEASRVGSGLVTLDTGFPGPGRFVTSPLDYLNNSGEMIYLNRLEQSDVPRVITRAQVKRRKLITELPPLPGAPPDGAAVDTVRSSFPRIVRSGGSYLTTPPRCPRRGFWRNRIRFTYADGVTQTVKSRSRCRPGRG